MEPPKTTTPQALNRIRKNWDDLGRSDPFWAILSQADKRRGGWDLEEFFATGRFEIQRILADVSRLGLGPRTGRALDFGCGVGRLTQALAAHFEAVDGVDVAASMIEQARAYNRHGERCRYLLNESSDLAALPSAHYDFIYSAITLQHIEPSLTRGYLRELARVLAPGGVLLFQLPSEPAHRSAVHRLLRRCLPGPVRRALNLLRHGEEGKLEMHGLPRPEVEAILIASGCRLADVQPDRSAGEAWASFRYCAVK